MAPFWSGVAIGLGICIPVFVLIAIVLASAFLLMAIWMILSAFAHALLNGWRAAAAQNMAMRRESGLPTRLRPRGRQPV